MTFVMVTASLLLLIPYFAYVFDFLDPERVILRLAQQVLDAALGKHSFANADIVARQVGATNSTEHLADVAVARRHLQGILPGRSRRREILPMDRRHDSADD